MSLGVPLSIAQGTGSLMGVEVPGGALHVLSPHVLYSKQTGESSQHEYVHQEVVVFNTQWPATAPQNTGVCLPVLTAVMVDFHSLELEHVHAAYVYARVHMCVHVNVCARTHVYHMCAHAYEYIACVHVCTCAACVCACVLHVCMCIHTHTCTCLRKGADVYCVHVCTHACVCVHVCMCVRAACMCAELPGTPGQECVLSPPVGVGRRVCTREPEREQAVRARRVPRIGRKTETDRRRRDVGRDREEQSQF